MAVVKNLMVRAGADFSGMRREMMKATQSINDFKRGVGKAVTGIVASFAAMGAAMTMKSAIKSAMDVEAAIVQINRQMGNSAREFVNWANDSAAAFGMSRAEALKYGSVYGNLISTFSKDTAKTTQYTEQLLKASAVVASGTGRTMDDVMERIRSGMLGNTEAIEDLGINVGINMIQSTKAFRMFAGDRSWDQLDFQTQQQIRLFAILEQASSKYGDSLANNTNTKMLMFTAQLKNVQLSLGQAFLPIVNIILPALTRFATALATVMNIVAQFSQALFGKNDAQQQAKQVKQQAAAVNGLADAYDAAGQAAKGSVAGFDEVNTLVDKSAGAATPTAAAPTSAMAGMTTATDPLAGGLASSTVAVSDNVQKMADKVKEKFGELSDFISQHKEIINAALSAVAGAILGLAVYQSVVGVISFMYSLVAAMKALSAAAAANPYILIAVAIGALIGLFVSLYNNNEQFHDGVNRLYAKIKEFMIPVMEALGVAMQWTWQNILVPFGHWLAENMPVAWDAVSKAAVWLWNNVLVPFGNFLVWLWNNALMPFGVWLAGALVKAWDAVSAAVMWLWKNVLKPSTDFFLWLIPNVIMPLAKVVGEVLLLAFQFLGKYLMILWQDVFKPLVVFVSEVFVAAITALSAVFYAWWKHVLDPLITFMMMVLKPTFKIITDVIVFLWENVLEPLGKFMGNIFLKVFENVFGSIKTLIYGFKDIIVGLLNFITGVFLGDWGKAWDAVKQVFKGVFESLWAIVKYPLNLIINGINTMIAGLNKISFEIPDIPGLPGGGKKFGISIPEIPALAKGGITSGPTIAMIGDNPGGQEVVSPLNDLVDIVQSAVGSAVMAASQMFGKQSGDIVIQMDGTTLARVSAPYNRKETARIGTSMIVTT